MALNKTGNLAGTNVGEERGWFPQYNQPELRSSVANVHTNNNNIPKPVGDKVSVNFVHDGRVPASPDRSQNRENRFGLNRENGHVRYEDLTNILGLKRMDSESSSDIGEFIPKKQPAAQVIENGVSPNILIKTQKGDADGGLGALRMTSSESISNKTGTRLGVSSPLTRHERSHSGSGTLDDSLSSGKMKFLCSFGGKILPRPGDGKLRYVGGETHIISIRYNILWEELMKKTLGICSQPHTIKYQLPGEDLDALISVSSDEDLQNMIEEYHGLESHEGSQKLRIFLVPLGESEETSTTEANTVLQSDPDYQYVVALNGVIDPSPKKNIESNYSATSFNFTPTIASSSLAPLENRDGNIALNQDGILNDSRNFQSSLRISPTPVQVAGSNTGYIQLLGDISCQGSIESNASFATAQVNSGNSSVNNADFRYPQQSSVTLLSDPHQHRNVGKPKNLNGQFLDSYNPKNGYIDQVFGGTLHKDKIVYSGNPICQQVESYGINNNPPHVMPHAFSDSQLHESGSRADYCSQEGISQSFSLNLENDRLPSKLVSQVNLMEGSQHDIFLHHPPKVESAEMHRWQEKNMHENSLKSERMMMMIEEKNPIPKKDNKVYEGNSNFNNMEHVTELHFLDSFPTNTISGKISMQKNWQQPCEDTNPSSSGMMSLSLNNLVGNTPSDLVDIGQKTSDGQKCYALAEGRNCEQEIGFSARNIDLNAPILKCSEGPFDKSSESDHLFKFSFDPDSRKFAQIQPSHNQITTGFHGNPTLNSEILYSTVLHDDVHQSSNLPVDGLDSSSKNFSFRKANFIENLITSTDQMVDQFKDEHSASRLSKLDDEIFGQSKYSERCNDANQAKPFVAVDVTGTGPSHHKSSIVHTRHDFDEVGSDVSPSHTEIESTIPESDPEDFKDNESDVNDLLSDAIIAEMEASIYGLQIIRNADLEELMELGSGTYGTVYHGKWRGTDVAIKRIKKSCFAGRSSEQERLAKDFWREAQILSNLHHPNVLAFYGIVPDGAGGTLATVTEYMVNGSLRHVLVKNSRLLDRRKKLIIAMDAAFGMEYLHSKNIVHFDLKCDNLLVNLRDPQRPICKVGDFGLSRIKRNTLVSGGVRGTLPWMAPELLNGNSSRVSEKVDVFSFGISMWELLTGEEPYADMHCGAIIGGIVKNTLRPPIPERCDPEWRKLMEECWSRDPEFRPSFTEITSRLRSMSMALQGKGNYNAWQLRPSNGL